MKLTEEVGEGGIELKKSDLNYCSPEFEHYMDTGEMIEKPCKCHKGFGKLTRCKTKLESKK